jgi:Xaa-Pro dipeptidase
MGGFVAVGGDNLQYLAGVSLPFVHGLEGPFPVIAFWPKGSGITWISPVEWAGTIRSLTGDEHVKVYSVGSQNDREAARVLADAISETCTLDSRIGLDLTRVSAHLEARLRDLLPDVEFVACDDWLRDLRMVKTPREIDLLGEVCYQTDHGIAGAIHHVSETGTKTEKYLAEDIRVHCLERGVEVTGYHAISLVASGQHSRKLWPLVPRYGLGWAKSLKQGEVVRLEMRSCLKGYWSNAGRMLTMGEPTPHQAETYSSLLALVETAISHMKPGALCSDVFGEVRREAKKRHTYLFADLGVGHGIGVSPYEPPYLSREDHTVLQSGMVLVIDPVVKTADGEIMRSKETVVILDGKTKMLGRYQSWRRPYLPAYTF